MIEDNRVSELRITESHAESVKIKKNNNINSCVRAELARKVWIHVKREIKITETQKLTIVTTTATIDNNK